MHMHRCQYFWLLFLQILQNYCNLNGVKPILVYDIGTVTITYSIIYKGERDLEIRQTMSRENVEKMC